MPWSRVTGVVLVAGVACAALAAPAGATTVNGFHDTESRDATVGVDVYARNGDRNDIVVEVGHRVRVRERGQGSLSARGNCRRESKKLVTCPRFDATDGGSLDVNLKDESDAATVDTGPFYSASVNGGDGRDVLEATTGGAELLGGQGGDRLVGGPRSDVLYGGNGRDLLFGNGGKDLLSGDGLGSTHSAGPSDDLLDGGAGRDVGSWDDRRKPVTVDLRTPAHGGVRGEHDTLVSIDGARGGRGRDRLVGDGGPNLLIGGPSADVMLGGGGNDDIDGGLAGDLEYGYGGGPDRSRDRIDCGDGSRDRVTHAGVVLPAHGDRTDALPQNCERIRIERRNRWVPRLRLGADRVRVQLDCHTAYYDCTRRVVLRSNGVELGRSPVHTTRSTKQFYVTVRLRRALAAGPPVVVLIRGTDRNSPRAKPERTEFRYRLLRPGR